MNAETFNSHLATIDAGVAALGADASILTSPPI